MATAPITTTSFSKTESVTIPHARDVNRAYHGDQLLNGVNVTSAKPSDAGLKPMFQLLAEASSPITPALLATHHLPGILLQHGPLAIRHITAHLISTVPGFGAIPPAKQRRLVVGALEGRGGEVGVDVVFEKVGWGRWDARRRGEPSRTAVPVPIEKDRMHSVAEQPVNSYRESGIFIQSEEDEPGHDVDMEDVDGDTTSSSEDDDMTDEEDWAQMGAAALRRGGISPITSDGWGSSPMWSKTIETPSEKRAREEREAVEALVKLSSV